MMREIRFEATATAQEDLLAAQAETGEAQDPLINSAISWYRFFQAHMARGSDIIITVPDESRTGKVQFARLGGEE